MFLRTTSKKKKKREWGGEGRGGGVQHTLFGLGGHIYPTQTKDKKVLPYKAWYGENPELVSVPVRRAPSSSHSCCGPSPGVRDIYNPFSPVSSSSSLFPNLNHRRHSASCPEYVNTPYFIFMSAFQLQLMGISLPLLFCFSHEIQGAICDSGVSGRFT